MASLRGREAWLRKNLRGSRRRRPRSGDVANAHHAFDRPSHGAALTLALDDLRQHPEFEWIDRAPRTLRARELRDLTRYRKSLVWERGREASRLQKVLEDANIKLASVASRPLGVSGKAMLKALCDGESDPEALADLAKGKLRAKLPALRAALEGRFRGHHALLVSHLLAHIEYLDETINSLSGEIEERVRPFERQVELLCTIPGVGERTAEVIIAELGPDVERFSLPPACRELGRRLPRPRRVRRQAPLGQDAQGR